MGATPGETVDTRKLEERKQESAQLGLQCLMYVNQFRSENNLEALQWNTGLHAVGLVNCLGMPTDSKDKYKQSLMEEVAHPFQTEGLDKIAQSTVDGWKEDLSERSKMLCTDVSSCSISAARI